MEKVQPKKPQKISATILVLVLCVVTVLTIQIAKNYFKGQPGSTILARSKGEPSAPVKIREFIDFQCPACAKGSLLLARYLQAFPGKIHLEMRYFPLENMHHHAVRSARYAECAARQGQFWQFHDLLIARQSEWRGLINADSHFQKMARDLNLDFFRMEGCLTSDEVKNLIMKEKEAGSSLGVQSTPTYFVNDQMVVGIKNLEAELKKLVGELPLTP